MADLITSPVSIIKGPWFLGIEELEELGSIITFVEEKLEASYDQEMGGKALEILEKGYVKNKDDAFKYAKENPFNKYRAEYSIISKDESILSARTMNELLVDKNLKNFRPKGLEIDVEYSNQNSFSFSMKKWLDGNVKYKIVCTDSQIRDEITYKLENWIDKNRSNLAVRIWKEYAAIVGIISFFMLSFSLAAIQEKKNPTTTEVYKSEIINLLNSGVTEENQSEAIELLLKIESNYFPKNLQPQLTINKTAIKLSISFSILLLVSILYPRSLIGVGKHKFMLKFYKFWSKFIIYTIPAIFFLPYIIEFIKSFFIE